MFIKKIIQGFFNFLGFKVSRLKKSSQRKYPGEAKKFIWLKKFNFKCVIDVGANEGQFAKKLIMVAPDVKLHCFEPISSVFEILIANMALYPHVTCYNYGLGESEGEKIIYQNEYSASSSLLPMLELHKNNFDFARKVVPNKIKIRTLDSFYPVKLERPLLLKIDVQGYEMYVLRGGEDVVQQADVIIIETTFHPLYEGQPLFHDIYKYLTEIGFKYAGNIEQLFSPKDNSILQADAVFIKSN